VLRRDLDVTQRSIARSTMYASADASGPIRALVDGRRALDRMERLHVRATVVAGVALDALAELGALLVEGPRASLLPPDRSSPAPSLSTTVALSLSVQGGTRHLKPNEKRGTGSAVRPQSWVRRSQFRSPARTADERASSFLPWEPLRPRWKMARWGLS
jgi:hypothetical protein